MSRLKAERAPVSRSETIRLSKFSGGYEPDPTAPQKIETIVWSAPPFHAAIPELLTLSQQLFNNGQPLEKDQIKRIAQEIARIEYESSLAHAAPTEFLVSILWTENTALSSSVLTTRGAVLVS